jgi:hypothetical protein
MENAKEKFDKLFDDYYKNEKKIKNDNFIFPKYLKNKEHPFHVRIHPTDYENFCGYDSEERFKENLKIMPLDWKYRTKEVKYRYNSSGYRTYEWKDIDWKNAIVVLGCSIVFGVGLAEDETMCHQIEKMTGRQTINLGYGGGSNDIIVSNCASLINTFGAPYAVVIGWTSPDRFTFYNKIHHIDVGKWFNQIRNVKKMYDLNVDNEYHLMIKSHYMKEYIKALFLNRTKFIDFTFFKSISLANEAIFFETNSLARDLAHPSQENNYEVAQYLLNLINN